MTYPTPCEAEFQRLSQEDPDKLLEWVKSGELEPADMTFAAEYLGLNPKALPALLTLLSHPSPMVREGTVYGLGQIWDSIYEYILDVCQNETSPGVRGACIDTFDIPYCLQDLDEQDWTDE